MADMITADMATGLMKEAISRAEELKRKEWVTRKEAAREFVKAYLPAIGESIKDSAQNCCVNLLWEGDDKFYEATEEVIKMRIQALMDILSEYGYSTSAQANGIVNISWAE